MTKSIALRYKSHHKLKNALKLLSKNPPDYIVWRKMDYVPSSAIINLIYKSNLSKVNHYKLDINTIPLKMIISRNHLKQILYDLPDAMVNRQTFVVQIMPV